MNSFKVGDFVKKVNHPFGLVGIVTLIRGNTVYLTYYYGIDSKGFDVTSSDNIQCWSLVSLSEEAFNIVKYRKFNSLIEHKCGPEKETNT